MTRLAPDLFVSRATLADGELTIDVSDGRANVGTLTFQFVRSFLFVKESDFWPEIEKIQGARLFTEAVLAPRVHRVSRGALGSALTRGRFDEEAPSIFLVWTPDECFEVVGFAEPVWDHAASLRV